MYPRPPPDLSSRERQVMDALFRLRRATVAELVDAVAEDVSYSAVRSVLRVLREKGHVAYREDGPRYVYTPSLAREKARSTALEHLVGTFFDGCPEAAAAALLDMSDLELSERQLRRLQEMVERARERGRRAESELREGSGWMTTR